MINMQPAPLIDFTACCGEGQGWPTSLCLNSHIVHAHSPVSLFIRRANEIQKRLSSAKRAVGPLIDLDFLPCSKLINETFNVTR